MNFGKSGNINQYEGIYLYCYDDEKFGSLSMNSFDHSLQLNSDVSNILENHNSPLNGKNSIFVSEFNIVEKYRNQGYGTRLLTEVEKYLKEINIEYFFLTCELSNYGAKNFYDKFGLEEVGKNDQVFLLIYKIS